MVSKVQLAAGVEHKIAEVVFLLILFLFSLYGIRFIQLTIFSIDGGRYAIDLWDKTDKVIARSKPRSPKGALGYADYRPGPIKWDNQNSLGKLQPDVIARLVDDTLPEPRPFLEGRYTRVEMVSEHINFPIYVRNDSHIIRDQLEARIQ